MRQEFEVSVEELLRTLKRRGIPLPSEMGAFITLEVCEQIIDRPAYVSTEVIAIDEIGEVLCTPRGEVSESEAVRLLLLLLGDLLVCSAPGVPGMLLELVERGPSEATLDRLRDDLEASLLPLNRGATRRVLARLLREARKAGQTGRPSKQPNAADVDAQLDALLDNAAESGALADALEPAPARARPRPAASEQARADVPRAPRVDSGPARASALEPAAADPRGQKAASARDVDLDGFVEQGAERRPRAGHWLFLACLVATLGAVALFLGLGREGSRSALGMASQPSAAKVVAPIPAPVKRSYGELRVNSTPAKAQVLLGVGPGPALATDIPLGVAQEFVALAEGYAAARALVPADAAWEEVDGTPRFELAIQADKLAPGKLKAPLGATLLPRDVGTPRARAGTVRVVTTPKGAKVYQLVGFTPEVRVENLPLDQAGGYDVLVYLEGHVRVTRHLDPTSFEEREGKRIAELEVTLVPAKGGE